VYTLNGSQTVPKSSAFKGLKRFLGFKDILGFFKMILNRL